MADSAIQQSPIYIDAYNCLSPAGLGVESLLEALHQGETQLKASNLSSLPHGSLPPALHSHLEILRLEKSLRDQDMTSLMGVYLARTLKASLSDLKSTGLIIGSSRGPTENLEKSFAAFSRGQRLGPAVSPTTTSSGLAAAVARDLHLEGPSLFLSAACSTGLYSVIQGIASLKAGLCESFLAGGVEAANTLFTFEMLKAARVLSPADSSPFPCRPGAEDRKGMTLSEGAALLLLSNQRSESSRASIIGWGAATEAGTLTGVSENGDALVKAIQKAFEISGIALKDVDLIVGHGAGTLKGDSAELAAYDAVFAAMPRPALVWHKWCSGHMLGASSALSVMLACEHLKAQNIPGHPYFEDGHSMRNQRSLPSGNIALIVSMGFGGSATAILVKNLS